MKTALAVAVRVYNLLTAVFLRHLGKGALVLQYTCRRIVQEQDVLAITGSSYRL